MFDTLERNVLFAWLPDTRLPKAKEKKQVEANAPDEPEGSTETAVIPLPLCVRIWLGNRIIAFPYTVKRYKHWSS